MRPALACLAALLLLPPAVRAVPVNDPVLAKTLQICQTSGLETALLNLYADRPVLAAELKEKVSALTRGLGVVIDTEVVATHPIGKRLVRFYVAVYFVRRPLWLRIDRYAGRDDPVFLPPRYSLDPDEILPGYLTEYPP